MLDINLNFKRLFFHLSNFVLIFFLLLLILFLNSFLTVRFDFLQNSIVFIIFLSLLGSILFLIFSKKILKSLLTSDESLKNSIKNTLHELNIPTSTIKINTQLLKKSISDEKTLQRVERIEKANESLFELYKNMEYEFQKVLENIDKEEFYLLESINKTLDKFEDIKKDTKIDLNLKDISLYSDYKGFLIVLDNLISNAIKYNDKKNPYIKIELNENILSIFNKGEKIDAKNLMLVFDRFFQEDSSNIGHGIGLAVVKEYCDRNRVAININNIEDGVKISLNLKNIVKQA